MNTELEQMRQAARYWQDEVGRIRLAINEALQSYERYGEISVLEGQPLIYAQVLLDLGEMIK